MKMPIASKSMRMTVIMVTTLAIGVLIGHFVHPRELMRPRNPEHASRVALFNALPGHADIVMLGDSITARGDWRELLPTMSVINRGVDGDMSKDVVSRLGEVIARSPNIVFIMIGINDILLGIDHRITLTNIETIGANLEKAGAKPVIQSVLLVEGNNTINAKVAALNLTLSKVGREFLDLNPVIASSPGYTWDSLHLTGVAYLRWRDAVLSYLDKHH